MNWNGKKLTLNCFAGEAGGWRGKFTPEQEAKIDEYVKRHLEGTGLTFKY